jgi:predicted nuclease of predicted toxin-antitoxin system
MRVLADENVHMDIITGLRHARHEVQFVPDIGLAGHRDIDILRYSEKKNLILLTADKDFGGLIEFGKLWGIGKVILLRYHTINIPRIVQNISYILTRERKVLVKEAPLVFVLSESGYRLHRPVKAK